MAVRFDSLVWREAVRGFSRASLEVAISARTDAERRGVAIADVLPCAAFGPDGTELAGCAKLYLPLPGESASRRPFAFVLQLAREAHPDGELVWVFVALRPRHPGARRSKRLRARPSPPTWQRSRSKNERNSSRSTADSGATHG